tara:strand:+ start:366 stop:683 length:318 start_codon:yes stop_codon:yes gene_type:complete
LNIHPTDYTKQENLIAECLSDLGFRFEQQTQFGSYQVDFWIPELKLVIEADGVYGHLKKRDIRRDTFLMNEPEIENIFHIKVQTKFNIQEEIWRALSKLSEDETP